MTLTSQQQRSMVDSKLELTQQGPVQLELEQLTHRIRATTCYRKLGNLQNRKANNGFNLTCFQSQILTFTFLVYKKTKSKYVHKKSIQNELLEANFALIEHFNPLAVNAKKNL